MYGYVWRKMVESCGRVVVGEKSWLLLLPFSPSNVLLVAWSCRMKKASLELLRCFIMYRNLLCKWWKTKEKQIVHFDELSWGRWRWVHRKLFEGIRILLSSSFALIKKLLKRTLRNSFEIPCKACSSTSNLRTRYFPFKQLRKVFFHIFPNSTQTQR